MEITEILKALERNTGRFPGEAVEAAIAAREAITPELLRILEDTVERAEEIVAEDSEEEYFAHIYALFLLAQFRETRAYPLVVRLARLKPDTVDALIGDCITEDLGRILASVCDGDTRPIEDLAKDAAAEEYVRGAGLDALLVLLAMGDKPRDEVVGFFRHLFEGGLERTPAQVWNELVCCASDIHPGELMEHIEAAFDEGLIDPGYVTLDSVQRDLKRDKEAAIQDLAKHGHKYIGNTVDEMSWWACFKDPEPLRPRKIDSRDEWAPTQPVRQEPKILPNDRCPCGSGRKYKKCCGRQV